MNYKLLVISRIQTDIGNQLVIMTFYPTAAACIKPRQYERIVASYVHTFEPGIDLAESISNKGKKRLKVLLRNSNYDEDERRALGTTYYSAFFNKNCGDNETQKGIADILYQTMHELYTVDASTEDAWSEACKSAVESVENAAARQRLAVKN